MNTQMWTMRVREYMKQNHMAEPGDGVLAAVSGGADSVCLLLALHALQKKLNFDIIHTGEKWFRIRKKIKGGF